MEDEDDDATGDATGADAPEGPGPDSLLPYDRWFEDAQRQVVARALAYAGANGLPGEHHFYLTFRTDHPGTVVPARLRAQYPREMTIVLQHQFHELRVDEAAGTFSVGLSFGGVPGKLVVPLVALTAFADPYVQFGLRFRPPEAEEPAAPAPTEAAAAKAPDALPAPEAEPASAPTPQVVSLDAFRRRPAKD
jgi:uncharacterized protein